MTHQNPFRTRPATRQDRSAVTRLWSEHIPAHRATADDRFDSVYLDNPHGTGTLTLLEAGDGSTRGAQGLLPRDARMDGNGRTPLGILVDMVVDDGSRTLGPALMLLRATLRRETGRFDTVYTFCSPTSEPVFRRAGMQPWVETSVFKRPIDVRAIRRTPSTPERFPRSRRLATAVLESWSRLTHGLLAHGIRLEVQSGFGPEIDELWDSAPLPGYLVGRRSRTDLEWRFGSDRKIRDLRVICAYSVSSGRCVGYAVLSLSEDAAAVVDIYAGPNRRAFMALLSGAVAHAGESGAAVATLEFTGPSDLRHAIVGSLFIPRDTHTVLRLGSRDGGELDVPLPYLTAFDREP